MMNRTEILNIAKPILFNTEMVRAILDGRKTATRRLMKNPPPNMPTAKFLQIKNGMAVFEWDCSTSLCERKPLYLTGDYLYVRETWNLIRIKKPYRAVPKDYKEIEYIYHGDNMANSDGSPIKWHPSIHMPKEAARIFLRVSDVRAERLQDISDEQAKAEGANINAGITEKMCRSAIDRFIAIWDNTIKKTELPLYGWDANPWVWVYGFEKVEVDNGG